MTSKDMYYDIGYDMFSNLALLLMSKGYITAEERHNIISMKALDFLKYISSRHVTNNKDKA